MIDDGEALAECVGFFHVVRGKQNSFAALVVLANDFPEQQACLRIEAGAGLVQEEHLRIVHHGAGDGETLHHSAGKTADDLIGAVGELEALEKRFRALVALVRAETKIGAVKNENFASRQRKVEIGTLGYDANQPFDGGLFFPDVMFADPGLASGRADARGENADGCRFSRAVRAEQAENFAWMDFERNSIERDDFCLGLFALASFGGEGKAPPEPAASGGGVL